MSRRRVSASTFVVAIIGIALLALVLVLGTGVVVVNRLAETSALQRARSLTEFWARELQEHITDRMVRGSDPEAHGELASLVQDVQELVPPGTVARVKIWRAHAGVGEIVYSDLPALIGLQERLDQHHLDVLHTGAVLAQVAPLDRDEERTERALGPLTEVYTRIVTPTGEPLLFETYQSSTAIAATSRDIARTFIPVLAAALLVTVAIEAALAVALIRRLNQGQRERETLMRSAIDASARERRKIAGDLHDGPIQEMAGLCLALTAEAHVETDPYVRERLQRHACAERANLRSLRQAIAGLYPPNLQQTGLENALADLLERLPEQPIQKHLTCQVDTPLDATVSELIYRASQEALRNIEKHAHASNVWIGLHRHGHRVSLSVRDDGRGGARINGHVQGAGGGFGLAMLRDIIHDAGGRMTLTSNGTGTTLNVTMPT